MAQFPKPFTVDVPISISDDFQKVIETQGYVKYKAVAAAIRLFNALPTEVRARIVDTEENNVYAALVDAIRQKEFVEPLKDYPAEKVRLFLLGSEELYKKLFHGKG